MESKFKVGDVVRDVDCGVGVISRIEESSKDPIIVRFISEDIKGRDYSYYEDGRYFGDGDIDLQHVTPLERELYGV